MKFCLTLLPLLLAAVVHSQTLSASKWQDDVKYFREEIPKRHKNAFHTVNQEEFYADVDRLIADIPTLKEYEIIVRLMQITAKVGDGHTRVHFPSFQRYPMVVNWFGDELRVQATTAGYEQILGARLVGIDDLGLQEIKQKISTVVSKAEPYGYWLNMSAAYLSVPEITAAVGIANDVSQATFLFQDSIGREFRQTLPALPVDPARRWISASKTIPLFRQKQNEAFWFSYIEELKAVYVNWKKYDELNKDSKELFAFIKAHSTERLIVDLRFNGGGDYFKGRKFMIDKIKSDPVINQKGHLFVITGKRTFSAAMVNSIDFKKETNAILVGEPPGERPNSYSENDEMKLPNSRQIVSYSIRYYKFLDEDVDAFEPDVRIDPSWKEFYQGRDAVIEWITEYCKKSTANN
jgi:hypothetical protein